jgi:hypothetical protein
MVIRINKGKARAVRYVGTPHLDAGSHPEGALWFRFESTRSESESISAGDVTIHLGIDELRRLLALAEKVQS